MQEAVDEIIEHSPNYCNGCSQSPETVSGEPASRCREVEISGVQPCYIEHLSVRQFLPYRRIRQFFWDIFHLPLSEGSIDNILAGMSKKSEVIYKEIQARIAKSEVAGADETGCHVNGKKHRFHASSVINTTVKNGQDVFTAYKFWLCTKFYRPE